MSEPLLEEMVDEDIAAFSAFFQSLGNDPLSKFESSIIKTYLHWKTHEQPRPTDQATTSEGTDAEEATG